MIWVFIKRLPSVIEEEFMVLGNVIVSSVIEEEFIVLGNVIGKERERLKCLRI